MKGFKSLRTILLSGCIAVAAFFGALLLAPTFDVATAKADGVLTASEYQTDGASVRVFERQLDENGNDVFKETSKQGIRFHVEMGAGYTYGGKEILNTAETYERGSYKITDGFKTYTLVLPTRLLSGDLTVDTDKVMKIETTEYWFDDKYQNWESVAYVYNVPEKWHTDNFSFRGVICTVAEDGTETVVASTEIAERNLTWVAKQAYNDTIAAGNYWGSAELDTQAAGLIKEFIPTYSITYKVNGVETTEEVLWGDAPQSVPTEGVKGAWYDTEGSEAIDVTQQMNYSMDRTLVLETTTSTDFVLTGVATQTDFEVTTDNTTTTYNGFKVFATLHREAFANKTKMDAKAVNIEHKRGDAVLEGDNAVTIQGVWTMEEQNSLGEWQMLLFFAFDTSKLQNGDQIIIKGDSVFYANNVMYKLTEDYTINYTKNGETEDYGMFLGYLYNSDVKTITNCSEDSSGAQGEPDEFTVRVEFYEDVMINGEFTFEFGPDSDTTKYPYPVYIQCGEDENKLIPISGGRYYWNEGNHKILELIGAGDYENKVFGWHDGDELFGAPGTIVKQNGGYYIFQDEMYTYFLTNGMFDTWGYALGDWVVGDETAQFAADEFAAQGDFVDYNDGTPDKELRVNTVTHWFPGNTDKVNMLTTENMSDSAPYAVYRTAGDGTVTEIEKVRYHGTANTEGGYYQILGFCGLSDAAVGDTVTIAAGARFWLGVNYYTVTEEITYYYTGSFWAQNYDVNTMGELSSASFEERAHNQGDGELRMYFTAPLAGYTEEDYDAAPNNLQIGTGSITFNGNAVTYVRYQRWNEYSTWLAIGGTGMIGKVALGDKVVIEAGTTIWSASNVAYKFTEKVEWIYAGPNSANSSVTWSRVLGGVTVAATTENASVSGVGTFAVGNTYTLTVAPADGYLISEVIVNNVSLPLTADNTYTFTVAQSNVIKVQAVVGHKVYFTVPEGAVVNGGAIANGGFNAVAHGGAYEFTVEANEGYKLTGVAGATNNGDGTYTVSNVTADTTVTIAVEKLYKVTYSGENASITANVANGTYVDNGTTVTFTVSANSGYTLVGVSNTTKVNDTTYTATVNGADLNVTASALENSAFTDITDRLQIEDRTSWGAHDGEVYVGLLDTEKTYTGSDGSTNHYFNTHANVNNTWYVGNTAPITANGGVDIMEYIYVNGTSARKLITDNANGVRNANGCACWLSNPAAYPVYVETTNGSGLMMRLATATFGTEFTITIKAGFRITNADDELVAVTKDIEFVYSGSSIARKYSTASVSTSNASVSGITDGQQLTNGETYTFTAAAASGYALTSVTINGTEQGTSGSYTFTASGTTVSIVVTAKKLYAVTWSKPTGATISVTANGSAISSGATVVEGTSISVTATASSGYQVTGVTANGSSIGTNSGTYTVNSATTIAATAKKLYTVTATTSGGVTVDATSKQVVEGGSVTFTLTVPTDATIKANGTEISETTYTVSNVTANTTVAFTTWYQVTVTTDGATVSGVSTGLYESGTVINPTVTYSYDRQQSFTINGNTHTNGGAYTISEATTIEASSSQYCIVEGTMITLADGTQKAVEDLQVGDMLLVFNHYTGEYDARPLAINAHADEVAKLYEILNVNFSNGAQWRIVGHHGIFDMTLNEYVMISAENIDEFVGHEFYYTDGVTGEAVVLASYYATEEFVKVYSPATVEFANYFANGLLNAPPLPGSYTAGQMNYFDFDENMMYINVQEDIEKYGLYTYEDFADYISEDVFNALPFKYFKISVEKGIMTWNDIMAVIDMLWA